MTTKAKQNALKAAFKTSKKSTPAPVVSISGRRAKQESGMVLIGANFLPHVRKTIKLIEVDTDRPMKSLLGEAINDLAAKYGKPQPYTEGQD